jgi:two-component system, NtrC family, sensor histidine kinase KinB
VLEPEHFAINLTTFGRLIGEHLPMAAAATQGTAHVLRWVNPAFCRLVGAPASSLVGRAFLETIPAARYDGAGELFDRVLVSGQESSSGSQAGAGLPSRSYSVAPLFGDDGSTEGLLIRVDESTELLLAREPAAVEELRETNQRLVLAGLRAAEQFEQAAGEAAHLNALLDSLHEAVTIADAAGRVLLMNPAALALWGVSEHNLASAAQVIRQGDLRRLDGSPLPEDEWPVNRALQGERFKDVELLLVRADATQLRLLSSGSAIRDDDDQVLLAIVFHRDVTALRLLEQTKEEYLALISHDLRTPLTAVQAEAQLLQRQFIRDGNADSPHVKRTQAIVANARRMNAMIQELLESSRLESGTMKLRSQPLELVELVDDIVSHIGSHRVRVQLPASTRPIKVIVTADAERVERVLTNLITNALKYSPSSSHVTIRVQRQRGQAVVSVVDKGAGIPREELARLFQRFTRGRAGSRADVAGLGLGLYIARLIVEAHGGQLWAESALDKGSTFSFSLPLATPASGTPPATTSSALSGGDL